MFHDVIDLLVAKKNDISEVNEVKNNIQIVEELDLGNDVKKIKGVIKGETEKALLLQMNNNNKLCF